MTKRAQEAPRVALSVRQPRAWALLFGSKNVENRTLIHPLPRAHLAPRFEARDRRGCRLRVRLVANSWSCDHDGALEHYREHDHPGHRGAVLGSLNLTRCRHIDELPTDHPLRQAQRTNQPRRGRDDPHPLPRAARRAVK